MIEAVQGTMTINVYEAAQDYYLVSLNIGRGNRMIFYIAKNGELVLG